MPAVKMVPIRNEDGQVVAQYFEPSNSFSISAQKNRQLMFRPDGRPVNVNRKLQARGHYDDKHGFTTSPATRTETVTVAANPSAKERIK